MTSLFSRTRKLRHILRNRFRRPAPGALRLSIEKARWLGGARSPVVLMVDDLTNAWHIRAGRTALETGGDWGGRHHDDNGATAFLQRELLQRYPEVRTTFFVVAGPISSYTHHQPFGYSAAMDADPQSIEFFTSLARDPRFELAYHGYDHGASGDDTDGFRQEWRIYASREAAVTRTIAGLDIFRRASGVTPTGGKYGGWQYNEFSDGAVSQSGFLWWCRDWMPRDVTGSVDDAYYEPQFFGDDLVVALPSTVHGHLWDPRQIDVLLERQQVISIEEHIAPFRPDELVQTPNIVDDAAQLRRLYSYLRGKSVWHATCGDIASYVIAREQTVVCDVGQDCFSLRYLGRAQRPLLSLWLGCSETTHADGRGMAVIAPDGTQAAVTSRPGANGRMRRIATVPVMDGTYRVLPQAAAGAR